MKRKNYLVNFSESIENNSTNFEDTRELLTLSEKSNDKNLVENLILN